MSIEFAMAQEIMFAYAKIASAVVVIDRMIDCILDASNSANACASSIRPCVDATISKIEPCYYSGLAELTNYMSASLLSAMEAIGWVWMGKKAARREYDRIVGMISEETIKASTALDFLISAARIVIGTATLEDRELYRELLPKVKPYLQKAGITGERIESIFLPSPFRILLSIAIKHLYNARDIIHEESEKLKIEAYKLIIRYIRL